MQDDQVIWFMRRTRPNDGSKTRIMAGSSLMNIGIFVTSLKPLISGSGSLPGALFEGLRSIDSVPLQIYQCQS